MIEAATSKRTVIYILLICFASLSYGESEKIVSLKRIEPDRACGPRCLWALIRTTGAGKRDCGIKCIYELIGKKPFTATNMKELKEAAEKLGFSAGGYKLAVSDLEEMAGYAILPVGMGAGAAGEPLHFILVKGATKDYVTIVNTKTFKAEAVSVSDLQRSWNGFALVISAGKGDKPLRKDPDDIQLKSEPEKGESKKYDGVMDFGHVDGGLELEHTFTITDKGDDSTKAKVVSKNCSCLKAELGKDTAGRTTLTLKLHVDKPAWQDAHAVVLLEPAKIIKRYMVRAYGKDTFQIIPALGHIEAPAGGVIEYPVIIDYFTDVNDVVEFEEMQCVIPNLTAGPVRAETAAEGPAARFSFEIPLIYDAGPAPDGVENIAGKVAFLLNTGKGQRMLMLRLTATIGTERFRLMPEKVFIMASKSGESAAKKVKLEFLNGPAAENIVVEPDGTLPVEVRARQTSQGGFIIDLAVAGQKLQELSPGLHKGKITIFPQGSAVPGEITLPVSLFVRQ